jgi:excisionase family DNA binding protein
MTTCEVSEYLRISRASVYRLVKMKKIPVVKIGRQLRFRKDVIDGWLSAEEAENNKP